MQTWALVCVGLAVGAVCCLAAATARRKARRRSPLFFSDYEDERKAPGRLLSSVAKAAADGDSEHIRGWLDATEGRQVDARTSHGRTVLHCAAMHGQNHIMRLLLEAGADVQALDNATRTALHLVAAHGHGTCVKMLLDAGSDPTLTDAQGASPISLAEKGGHLGSLRLMRLHVSQSRALNGYSHLHPR